MTTPPEWVTAVPSTPAIHDEPAGYQWQGLTEQELSDLRGNLIEAIVSVVMEAILGFFPFLGGAVRLLGVFFSDLLGLLGHPLGLGTGDASANSDASQVPLLGPVMDLIDNIMAVIGDLPIIGPLITQLFDVVSSFFAGFISFLGGGGIPSLGGIFDPTGLLGGVFRMLGNLLTSVMSIPAMLLGGIAPTGAGTPGSLVPDPTFSLDTLAEQQDWWWDGAVCDPTAIRTRRSGVITLYLIGGAIWTNQAILQLDDSGIHIDPKDTPDFFYNRTDTNIQRPLDATYYDVVNVPYVGGVFGFQPMVTECTTRLIKLIKDSPGKFALMGMSQCGGIASNIYDELRTGSLQDRNDDFVGGFVQVNMRRQAGWPLWPDGTVTEVGPNFCASGEGIVEPNLTNCDDRWWEWTVTQGQYPTPAGEITVSTDDYISCCPLGSQNYYYHRLLELVGDAPVNYTFAMAIAELVTEGAQIEAMQAAANVIAELFVMSKPRIVEREGESAHGVTFFRIQPLIATGLDPDDERTYWQIMLDWMNTIGPQLVTPPAEQDIREIEMVPFVAQPGQIIPVTAQVEWLSLTGVAVTGDAIKICVNAYNSSGALLETLTDADATVTNPSLTHTWQTLTGNYMMPSSTATARIMLHTSAAMTGGAITWFTNIQCAAAMRVDAAQIANVENIPQLPATTVDGIQGQADIGTSMQTLLDGLASANSDGEITDVEIAQLFALTQQTANNANTALALAESLMQGTAPPPDPEYHLPETTTYTADGDYTFTIPVWARTAGVLFDLVVLGGGGIGHRGSFGWTIGTGGAAGTWAGSTKTYGTHIPGDATTLSVHVGAGGATLLQSGAASTITATGMTTVTGAGGLHGGNDVTAVEGAGMFVWADVIHYGGVGVAMNKDGSAPGGGGGGATAVGHLGIGADGYVSIRVRQP